MAAIEQARVLDFLEGGGLGAVPERIDTHAAIILLTPERAYKLKRPVRYSFLDFTSLERRERTLRHELELNRANAPELYLRVLPVTAEPSGLALDGPGEPIEWLLEMRRFPAEAQLDRVAAATGLDGTLVDRLAETLARAHAAAAPRSDMGGLATMREIAQGNRVDLDAAVPAVFTAQAVRDLDGGTEDLLVRRGPLLDQRRAAGLVRHCHGDLHLANIVLLEDRPVLFDCIEFDDGLACIDVMYDLAFLLMAGACGAGAWLQACAAASNGAPSATAKTIPGRERKRCMRRTPCLPNAAAVRAADRSWAHCGPGSVHRDVPEVPRKRDGRGRPFVPAGKAHRV